MAGSVGCSPSTEVPAPLERPPPLPPWRRRPCPPRRPRLPRRRDDCPRSPALLSGRPGSGVSPASPSGLPEESRPSVVEGSPLASSGGACSAGRSLVRVRTRVRTCSLWSSDSLLSVMDAFFDVVEGERRGRLVAGAARSEPLGGPLAVGALHHMRRFRERRPASPRASNVFRAVCNTRQESSQVAMPAGAPTTPRAVSRSEAPVRARPVTRDQGVRVHDAARDSPIRTSGHPANVTGLTISGRELGVRRELSMATMAPLADPLSGQERVATRPGESLAETSSITASLVATHMDVLQDADHDEGRDDAAPTIGQERKGQARDGHHPQ